MSLELAEQFKWELPDVIFIQQEEQDDRDVEGFEEPKQPDSQKRPKMIVQADGCAPIVKHSKKAKNMRQYGERYNRRRRNRIPVAVGDFLILRAVKNLAVLPFLFQKKIF